MFPCVLVAHEKLYVLNGSRVFHCLGVNYLLPPAGYLGCFHILAVANQADEQILCGRKRKLKILKDIVYSYRINAVFSSFPRVL